MATIVNILSYKMNAFFDQYRLKVLSGFFTNISAGWFIALFISKDIISLIYNLLLSILSLQVAFLIESSASEL